jgi:hypothetical protein
LRVATPSPVLPLLVAMPISQDKSIPNPNRNPSQPKLTEKVDLHNIENPKSKRKNTKLKTSTLLSKKTYYPAKIKIRLFE